MKKFSSHNREKENLRHTEAASSPYGYLLKLKTTSAVSWKTTAPTLVLPGLTSNSFIKPYKFKVNLNR